MHEVKKFGKSFSADSFCYINLLPLRIVRTRISDKYDICVEAFSS